ncbi:MAG: hypothetical protein WD269_01220 [Acidimicrobiia bacterium]
MRLHRGTLLAGVIYLALGVAFLLEAMDIWTVRVADLRILFPAALVAIGIAVIIGTVARGNRQT